MYGSRMRSWWWLIVIAIAVGGAAAALARNGDGGRGAETGSGEALEVEHDVAGDPEIPGAPIGVARVISPAPVPPRYQSQAVWSAEELLVWSGGLDGTDGNGRTPAGELAPVDGGAIYDPDTDSWTELPPAPIASRVGAAAVWAGDRLVVWGGFDGSGEPLADGAAYLPGKQQWTLLPTAPLSPRGDVVEAWTGREVLIVGGRDSPLGRSPGAHREGAAYDPAADTWRPLPPIPAGVWPMEGRFRGAWLGEALFVWGRDAALYGPDTDRWERVRSPSTSVWPGGSVQVVNVGGKAAIVGIVLRDDPASFGLVYDPVSGTFDGVPGLSRTAMTRQRTVVSAGERLVLLVPELGLAGAWRRGDPAWQPLPPELAQRDDATTVWTGHELIVLWGRDAEVLAPDGFAWRP